MGRYLVMDKDEQGAQPTRMKDKKPKKCFSAAAATEWFFCLFVCDNKCSSGARTIRSFQWRWQSK